MKRITALLLAMVMVVSIMPTTTLATSSVPTDFKWSLGNCLGISWKDAEADEDTTYDIRVYHGASEDGPWTQADAESGWEKDMAYVVQCVPWTGPGFYKVAVSRTGEDNWGESAPYQVTMQAAEGHERISAPTSGSFDAETGTLSWTDPAEGVDYKDAYYSFGHTAVVRMWYTGATGELDKSEWTLVDKYFASEDSCSVNNFSTSNLEAGIYAFSINNLAEDYGWRGQSTTLILDERYTHVAPNTPLNVRWTTGTNSAYLSGAWNPPTGAASHDGYNYNVAVYHSPTGEDDTWKSLGYYYITTYSFSLGEMSIDPSYMAMYGSGYYKFGVSCSAASIDGEGEWAWSEALYVDLSSGSKGTIAAPLSGSFDAESQMLSWTNPAEGVDSNMYQHRAVLEMWYTGENGELDQSQWTRVGYESVYGTEREMRYLYSGKLKTGRYAFTVSNLAEDYLWRGMSEAVLLDGYYDHVEEEEPTIDFEPTNLYWTESGGISWDHPGDDVTGDFILELLWCADESDDPAEDGISLFSNEFGIFDAESWPNVLMELSYLVDQEATAKKEEMGLGDGVLYFRVKYLTDDGESAWAYSNAREMDGSGGSYQPSAGQVTDLQWHVVHMEDGTTKPMVGTTSFYAPNGGKFQQFIYYRAEYEDEKIVDHSGYLNEGWNNFDFFTDEPGLCRTGTYYYTVQLLGEDGTADGPIMTSPEWNYVRPNAVLQPTDLQWDMEQKQLTWEMDEDLTGWVSVEFYFNANEDNADEAASIFSRSLNAEAECMDIPSDVFIFGEGWYYFKVMQGSSDIAQALSGESELSSALYYTGPEKTLTVTDPQWTGEGLKMQWTIGNGDAELTQSYSVRYYYCDSADAVPDPDNWIHESWVMYGDPAVMPPYLLEEHQDGWYYFSVQAISSDPLEAKTSARSAISPALYYVMPTQKLSVSNLTWSDDGCLTWTKNFADDAPLDYYDVRYYYGATEAELQTAIDNRDYYWWTSYGPNKTDITIPNEMLRQCGTGYYAYEMRPYSADVTVILNGDWSAMSTFRHVEGASQKAPQPSDLLWHYDRYWADEEPVPMTGAISFAVNVPTDVEELEYKIELYRKGTSEDTRVGTLWTMGRSGGNEFATVLPFEQFPERMTSGTYYFTVTAVGDGILYNDSDPVTSGEWTYTRPDTQLTVSDPVWNSDMTMSWTDGAKAGDYYQIRYQHVGAGETFHEKNWSGSMTWEPDEGVARLSSNWLKNNGSGTYYFMVRAMSNDVEKAVPSDWSAWSTGFDYTEPDIQLDVENLRWNADTMAMEFDLPAGADASMVERYQIRVYYGESEEDYDERIGNFSFTPDDAPFQLPDWVMSEYGGGYYWFQVRVYSSDYTKAFDSNSYSELVSTPLYIQGPDTPAAQATDLLWNVERWNANNSDERIGVLSFKNPYYDDSTRTQFQVEIYRQEKGGDDMVGRISTRSRNQYLTLEPFNHFPERMTTGTYYFTVMTVGDNVNTCNSEPVTSGTWSYTRPDAQLTVSAPVWNSDMSMSWTNGTITPDYYEIHFQAVRKGEKFYEDDWHDSMHYYPENGAAMMSSWMLNEYGTADYYFRVRAMSYDVETAVPSDWSDWSAAYAYTEPTNVLTPKNITWDEDTLEMNWEVDTPEYVDYYEIELYYGAEADKLNSVNWFWIGTDMLPYTLPQWVFEEFGVGYYGFTVYAYSNNPMKAKGGEEGGTVIYISGDQTPLDPPTDLQWHVERWDEEESRTNMGVLSFANPYFDDYESDAEFVIRVYRKDADGDVLVGSTNMGTNQPYVTFNVFERANQRMISGDYYFTVYTRGNSIHTANSELAISETWTYNRPDQELSVSNPVWNEDMTMSWTNGDLVADRYRIRFQYVGAGDSFYPGSWNGSMTWSSNTGAPAVPAGMLEDYGAGTYYFQVLALPADVTVTAPSNWSDWSTGYVYSKTEEPDTPDTPTVLLEPHDLQWNLYRNHDGSESYEQQGVLSFENPMFDNYQTDTSFAIALYRVEENSTEQIYTWDHKTNCKYVSIDLMENFPVSLTYGDYVFAVSTISEIEGVEPSATKVSDTWTYGAPATVLPKLDAPTELTWDIEHLVFGGTKPNVGNIAFHGPRDANYEVKIYRADGTLLHTETDSLWNGEYGNVYYFTWDTERCQTGSYYFTVQFKGDGVTCSDSDLVTSEMWTYTRPERVLTAENLKWDVENQRVTWDADLEMLDQVAVHYYYNATEDDPNTAWNTGYQSLDDEWVLNEITFTEYTLNYGPGWYYFTVSLRSNDIGQALGSTSGFSAAYYIPGPEETDGVTSAEIVKKSEDMLTVNVAGNGEAELFIAVYDADGRMIGIEHTVMHEMSAKGSDHSVFFEGTPNTVRVFALDEGAVPYDTAVMLNVK